MGSSGELRRVMPVRVNRLADLARVAASIISLGQPAYILRFPHGDRLVYGLIAVLRDYYNYYGLPMIYYYVAGEGEDKREYTYILVKVDERGEHVELSKSTRPGWVPVPVIDLAEKPPFMPEDL